MLPITAPSKIHIHPASSNQVLIAISIINEAATWLSSKGFQQWQTGSFEKKIEDAANREELYLVKLDDQLAGTFILQWADPSFWGEKPDDAGYIHKLAIRRRFSAQKLGGFLLNWTEKRVVATGRKYLRLDCDASNPFINRYYLKAGFSYQGKEGNYNLYEKDLLIETF